MSFKEEKTIRPTPSMTKRGLNMSRKRATPFYSILFGACIAHITQVAWSLELSSPKKPPNLKNLRTAYPTPPKNRPSEPPSFQKNARLTPPDA